MSIKPPRKTGYRIELVRIEWCSGCLVVRKTFEQTGEFSVDGFRGPSVVPWVTTYFVPSWKSVVRAEKHPMEILRHAGVTRRLPDRRLGQATVL